MKNKVQYKAQEEPITELTIEDFNKNHLKYIKKKAEKDEKIAQNA